MDLTNESFFYRINFIRVVIALFSVGVMLFSACKPVGPDYTAPTENIPDDWDQQVLSRLTKEPKTDIENWWVLFNDTTLTELIGLAGSNNRNLKMAFSRVVASRAEVSGVSGSKLPDVEASASASESKISDEGRFNQMAPEGGFKAQSNFNVGVSASWEIDVFGRVRRSIESAGYAYEKSVEDYYDIMVILLSEVAVNYIDLRLQQQLIINTEENVKLQRESLTLAESMYNSGLTSYLDVLQARSNLAETESMIPAYKIGEFLAITRLAVLLGTTYDNLGIDLYKSSSIPYADPKIGVGIPADLLRQRPDIRAAERAVAMNNANIGVSVADLYPTFSLSGFLGLESQSVSNLFSVPGLGWGLSLPVSWQFINRKRLKANVAINEELTNQALLHYENVVLDAFTEVENLLTAIDYNQIRYDKLSEAVDANLEAVNLVKVQYKTGLTDFENILVTERSVNHQQNQKIDTEAQIAIDLVTLFKALGGGWTVPQDSVAVTEVVPE